MLEAVCREITPPMKADIKATRGIEFIPISSISSNILLRKTENFSGTRKMTVNIKKYFPNPSSHFIPAKLRLI
jgi:hypothetical protein